MHGVPRDRRACPFTSARMFRPTQSLKFAALACIVTVESIMQNAQKCVLKRSRKNKAHQYSLFSNNYATLSFSAPEEQQKLIFRLSISRDVHAGITNASFFITISGIIN